MKINALLLSSCHVLPHLNLVQGAKAEVAHDFSRNSVVEKSARPKESSALQGLDQLMGAHCGVPCLPRTKMPASTKSLNGVKVLRKSWRKWSIWIAHKEKKKGVSGGTFQAICLDSKSKSSLAAFPDVLRDHIHSEVHLNLSWCLAHLKVSA